MFCQVQEVAEVEETPEKTVVKKTCSAENPEVCNTAAKCSRAIGYSNGGKSWKKTSSLQGYV